LKATVVTVGGEYSKEPVQEITIDLTPLKPIKIDTVPPNFDRDLKASIKKLEEATERAETAAEKAESTTKKLEAIIKKGPS
jgi:hypothetical protein